MCLLASNFSAGMLGLGIALLVAILFRRIWIYRRRKKRKLKQPPLIEPRPAMLVDAPKQVVQWQVEMHATARDLKGELDTRIAVTQSLLARAERITVRLEAAIQKAERLGLTDRRDPLAAFESDSAEEVLASLNELREQFDGTQDGIAPPETLRQIYRLADSGAAVREIADRTGVPVGDVELALATRG